MKRARVLHTILPKNVSNLFRWLGISSIFAAVCSLGLVVSPVRADNGTRLSNDARASLSLSQDGNNSPQPLVPSSRSKSFFDGEVGNLWSDQVVISAQPELELIRAKSPTVQLASVDAQPEEPSVPPNSPTPSARWVPTSAEEIIKSVGNPNEPYAPMAQDNAPAPQKGMWAALAIGDKKLAARYARQYAQYLKDLDARSNLIAGLTGQAQGQAWASDMDQFRESRNIMNSLLKEEASEKLKDEDVEAETKKPLALDDYQLAALAEIGTDSSQIRIDRRASQNTVTTLSQSPADMLVEKTERQAIRKELSQALKTLSPGATDIFWFFDARLPDVKNSGAELEATLGSWNGTGLVTLTGMSVINASSADLAAFQSFSKVSFPLRNGAGLAASFQLPQGKSTVIFLSRSTKQVFSISGFRRRYVYDEVLKAFIRGIGGN